MRKRTVLLIVSLFATALAAQPLTVGTMPADAAGYSNLVAGTESFVNLINWANAAGTVDRVTVLWATTATCANAFKVVFLRNNLSSVSGFTVVAVRGPFSVSDGRNTVTLSPPVTVAQYDLIGIVQLQPVSACGSVRAEFVPYAAGGYRLTTTGDISLAGTLGGTSNYSAGAVMAAVAYNSANDPLLVRVLPAAGAVAGSGAFFRTSLQMLNTSDTTISGKLVFHPAGQSASPGNPSLPFTLGRGTSLSYPDVVTAMSASGLGSLDVFTDGGVVPLITARVYSDGGSNGTSGFTEDALAPSHASTFVSHGVLFLPSDTTNFRTNIGIRTLDGGAKLSIGLYDASGNLVTARSNVPYAPNYFEQATAQQFTGASTLPPGGYIAISYGFPGAAFVYATVTDNRTQDSSMRGAGPY